MRDNYRGEYVVLKLGARTSLGSTLHHDEFYIISSLGVSVQVSLQLDDNTTVNFSSHFQQFHLPSAFIISLFHTVAEAIKHIHFSLGAEM